jgi:hypothetical protein
MRHPDLCVCLCSLLSSEPVGWQLLPPPSLPPASPAHRECKRPSRERVRVGRGTGPQEQTRRLPHQLEADAFDLAVATSALVATTD